MTVQQICCSVTVTKRTFWYLITIGIRKLRVLWNRKPNHNQTFWKSFGTDSYDLLCLLCMIIWNHTPEPNKILTKTYFRIWTRPALICDEVLFFRSGLLSLSCKLEMFESFKAKSYKRKPSPSTKYNRLNLPANETTWARVQPF